MMKKSVEILGLPIISITEGRELGLSQTLLIDAKKGYVAAITIEDEDWYRGVKLIPFDSIVVIGDDAIIITSSENILRYDAVAEYENLLDANIRVLGTKAITKNGTIRGKVTEIFIGDDGKIEKCEVTAPDGTASEIPAGDVSIFGKQVTMIDSDAKKKLSAADTKPTVAANSFYASTIPVTPTPLEEAPPPAEEIPSTAYVPEMKTEEFVAPEELEEAPPVTGLTPEEDALTTTTQQAEALKAALKRAIEKGSSAKSSAGTKRSSTTQRRPSVDEKRPLMLLGKKAARTIKADTGAIIVEAGAEITDEVLQKARLSGKFIELSMNYVP